MKPWKKKSLWIGGAMLCPVAVYFLTAPFMLDYLDVEVWQPQGSGTRAHVFMEIYAPARAAVTRDWFGLGISFSFRISVFGLRVWPPPHPSLPDGRRPSLRKNGGGDHAPYHLWIEEFRLQSIPQPLR
jgi:hypothetical protein